MARPRSSAALVVSREGELREIREWYRERLAATPPPPVREWEPVKIGPTWQWDNGWVLPELTLGWDVLAWGGLWLRGAGGKPWLYTMEQARFILWFYSVDETGEWLAHNAVLQRLKGWGKDPLAACLATTAMVGPVTFDRFVDGRPVGREEPDAWIQIAAVSQDQTKNTMKLFPSLISREARAYYGIQIGMLNIWAMDNTRHIEGVTSSPLAIEGGRPTLIVRSETQNWNASNAGHDMAGVMDGNAAKSPGGAARMLDICNAYRPGEDSVGQRRREGWEKTQTTADREATHMDFGLMYDSLEAPEKAPLEVEHIPAVIEAVRGDSVWLTPRRVMKSVLDPENPPSESRRKWYNQIEGADDAWVIPREIDPLIRSDLVVEKGEEVALFFDAGKSDDATVLVGCRILDGHVFTLGMWQRPPGRRGDGWIVPLGDVDQRVQEVMETYRVVAFFADPSHAEADETQERLWDPLVNEWHRRYSRRLRVWARPGKDRRGGHAIVFDMALSNNVQVFTSWAELTLAEIKQELLTWDGDARMRRHLLNARRAPNRFGVSIAKRHRESRYKIDLAVGFIGARGVRGLIFNSTTSRKGGWVY